MKIEDYGFIGDTQTGALVGKNGSIDWLCMPRFDSDACFAALLGNEKNGAWQIAPKGEFRNVRQRYRKDTLILETEWETESGTVRVIDFMPPRGKFPDVVRVVEGVRGKVCMSMTLVMRFGYGLNVPWVTQREEALVAIAGPDALVLRTEVPTRGENLSTVAEFTVDAGEQKEFVLTWFPSHEPIPRPVDPRVALAETESYWNKWTATCNYEGKWRDEVVRSLITLKGLTYAPTGGIVAALTTSLPEKIGGVRNWDYRYCWVRDATFTLYALLQNGYSEEACAWRDWLLRAIAGSPSEMQIMYGCAGERRLTEFELPHLTGFENSTPVRIGNAASEQLQLDVYGEVLDMMYQSRRAGIKPDPAFLALERYLIHTVESKWREPDAGIWEIRGPLRHFTFSKVMTWVAMDRAIKSTGQCDLDGDIVRWKALREEIHRDVCANGYNTEIKSFTQYYGSKNLDASLLLLPIVGFLPVSDERIRNTIQAIENDLLQNGLVRRYRAESSQEIDGLPPGEGVFLPCSFWYADCLQLLGREQEAHTFFEQLLKLRSSLGLLAEEFDPTERRHLGNFPQALSHIGIINTARNLSTHHGAAKSRCGS